MLPNIWIIDTYSLMIFLGVIACFILFWLFRKKHKISEKFTYDIFLLACVAIGFGILFAVLFQLLFDRNCTEFTSFDTSTTFNTYFGINSVWHFLFTFDGVNRTISCTCSTSYALALVYFVTH